jgi:hypothetical protein
VDAIMAWAPEHPEESAEGLTRRFGRLIDTVFSIGSSRGDRRRVCRIDLRTTV